MACYEGDGALKQFFGMLALIASMALAHHYFVKDLSPTERATQTLAKEQRKARVENQCAAAKAAKQTLRAEGLARADRVVDVPAVCDPGLPLLRAFGISIGVLLGLGVVGFLLLAAFLAVSYRPR